MKNNNTVMPKFPFAAVAMVALAFTTSPANAGPVSIDFNVVGSPTESGEPSNTAGLQLPGQVGAWNALTVTGTAVEQTVTTTEGPTFTINPGGSGNTSFVAYQNNSGSIWEFDSLRADILALNLGHGSFSDPVEWELTGLVPNGAYSLIFFNRGYEGAYTAIDGVGAGSTEGSEGDYDFTDVVAVGGKISGTFDAPTATWYSVSGLQFEWTGGTAAPFAITEIEYTPDPDPETNGTVTLTWPKTGAASYIAKYSLDMTDWGADVGDGLTAALDENPGDADHITVTFLLAPFELENEPDLFFRIEEE